MKVVSILEAEGKLSQLIQDAIDGEEVVIARGSELVVRLVLVEPATAPRSVGWAKGKLAVAADFDAPLDDFEAR